MPGMMRGMRFKIIRIYVLDLPEIKTRPQAWKWLREAKPEQLEEMLDFQTVKDIVPDTWFGAMVKQITGRR